MNHTESEIAPLPHTKAAMADRFVQGTASLLTTVGTILICGSCCFGLLSPGARDTAPGGETMIAEQSTFYDALFVKQDRIRMANGLFVAATLIGSLLLAASGLALSGSLRAGSLLAPVTSALLTLAWLLSAGILLLDQGGRGLGLVALALVPVGGLLFLLSLRCALIWNELVPLDRDTATQQAIRDYEIRRRKRMESHGT